MSISPDASNAREAARSTDGRFGQLPRTAPGDGTAADATGPLAPVITTPLEHDGAGTFVIDRPYPDSVPQRVVHNAAVDMYRHRVVLGAVLVRLWRSHHHEVTVLAAGVDGVRAVEGTVFPIDGDDYLMVRGNTGAVMPLRHDNVLDASAGYGGAEQLARQFRDIQSGVPVLQTVHPRDGFEGLPDEDDVYGQADPPIVAAYVVDHPGFEGYPDAATSGCLFMATSIQRGDGPSGDHIVNGQFWAPDSSQLESERSSMYTGDLARLGAKVRDYRPGALTYRQSWQDMPADRAGAYRRLFGR